MTKPWTRFAAALAATLALTLDAAAHGPLLSAEQLAARLAGGDPSLVLDTSPPPMYAAGHIAGAVPVDVFSYAAGTLTPAQAAQRFQSWGLSPGRAVVITDQGASYMATHLYYELYRQGFPMEQVFVLDGGTARWKATGGAMTTAPTAAPTAGSFTPTLGHDAEVRGSLDEAVTASGDPAGHALVDALEPAYYYGERNFFGRAGHLPNARLWPSADFFNADKTFKPRAEIARMRDQLGIRPEQEVQVYCGGGVAASVPFFALKFLLEQPRVKLFAGSQQAWLRDERGLPMWTYAAPALLRDMQWLSGWNTAMTRAFGVARISVIDVRSAEAFAQGHLPFAQNLPAALLRAHRAEPEKLAALLASAGVKAADEAVIVGSGGLDRDTALAFALLERQGQQRVSVLVDSVEDWAFAGLPLEKTALPVKAVARAAPEPSGPGGSAAGATPVRLPYAALLDTQHRPQPARTLWQLLDKAGVPRYAPVSVQADDPGEVALGYLILKLMGYAAVRPDHI
ncbi:rhodanese-like domain-containing protein [Pelomonas sp. KK5]|uniref:rhodanese-like domain-containing protein n=1 Tax=Pelomonas sp. KK5 TaxID=1855730 RepID=UPI00097BAB68|nr:rhodanese-like domain-containing protein [Pelomonas sp. KK5]